MGKTKVLTKDEYKERLSKNIKKHRLENGYSQKDLAKVLRKTPVFVSNLERGKRLPSLETLIELTYAFQCSMTEIFKGGNEKGTKFEDVTEYKLIQRCIVLLNELDDKDLRRAEKVLKLIFEHHLEKK